MLEIKNYVYSFCWNQKSEEVEIEFKKKKLKLLKEQVSKTNNQKLSLCIDTENEVNYK
jgi:hypothetical protein